VTSLAPLPIDEALPALMAALAAGPNAVLVAPPGAGKTTRVPLALLDAPWRKDGRILVLEPRRLAARGAADRMARTLGEQVGGTVGLRARLDVRVSRKTRIEVVTEGVFARMILDDPALDGVAAVLFDEFHERSLDADMGLALALDAQAGLREDLRLLVMSATIDGARVAALLGAEVPVIASEGRMFPVETRYLGRDPRGRLDEQMAAAIRRALGAETGSVLAFLPGQAEIRRTAERLAETVTDPAIDIAPLFGAMDRRAQDLAVEPAAPGRRKVVLATSIAETSLTIEGVRVVVDSGLARVPRYEPDLGLTRLETVRAPRSSVDQRRGRAGRTEPGVCYRLWDQPQDLGLPPFAEAEIKAADLSGLILDLAAWGVADPARLRWLDPPTPAAAAEARAMLAAIGAVDGNTRITPLGRRIRSLPLPPRLAAMVIGAADLSDAAARLAADIAALLVERGLGGTASVLDHRLEAFRRDRGGKAEEMRRLARGWAEAAASGRVGRPAGKEPSVAALLALAWPDRIGMARGGAGQFLLASGRAASVEPHDPLARVPWIVAAELSGTAARTRLLLAAPMEAADVEAITGQRVVAGTETAFDAAAMALRTRRVRRLGAIIVQSDPAPVPPDEASACLLAEGLAAAGLHRLPWGKATARWRERVNFLRRVAGEAEDNPWPDLSDATLAATAADWLAPHLAGLTALAEVDGERLRTALEGLVPWELRRRIDAEAPEHFEAPTGTRAPVDYSAAAGPTVSIRVQELFGLRSHPALAGGRVPLVLELLSPAHRPIQITRDLPGFWRGSWKDVRSEMKARYPRHVWPEEPAAAPPTTRAKPRGT
jgi:ATP-dependent helicase HrpB